MSTASEINLAIRAYADTLEKDFYEFVKDSWSTVEPHTEFKDNWHIEAVCKHLQAVADGRIRRLVINIPPRSMKSTLVSVMFPAWVWTFKAGAKFLSSSYAQNLSTRDSLKSRRLILSDWYQRLWGDKVKLSGDQNLKMRYDNDQAGYRIATSTGGALTGEGGDFIIVDDPTNAIDSDNSSALLSTSDWFDHAMSTRLNDPKTGAFIIVMQRLNEHDLTGHILKKGGYDHLCITGEFEKDHPTKSKTILGFTDPRKVDGEILWPDRSGTSELDELKKALGSRQYNGQVQQRPVSAQGEIILRRYIKFIDTLPSFKPSDITISVDLTFGGGDDNDRNAFQVWGCEGVRHYLIEAHALNIAFTEQRRKILDLATKYKGATVIIENKANGSAAMSDLKGFIPNMIGIEKDRDKMSYLSAVAPMFEAGDVFFHSSTIECVEELIAFPKGRYKDHVDACSQYLNRVRNGATIANNTIIHKSNLGKMKF